MTIKLYQIIFIAVVISGLVYLNIYQYTRKPEPIVINRIDTVFTKQIDTVFRGILKTKYISDTVTISKTDTVFKSIEPDVNYAYSAYADTIDEDNFRVSIDYYSPLPLSEKGLFSVYIDDRRPVKEIIKTVYEPLKPNESHSIFDNFCFGIQTGAGITTRGLDCYIGFGLMYRIK